MAIYTKEGSISELEAIQFIRTYRVVLFKNNLTPDRDTVYSDLDLCDYSGYSPIAIPSWGTVAINGDGNAQSTAGSVSFTHDGGATANNVYGWALVIDTDDVISLIDRFPGAPLVMADVPDEIIVTVRKTQGGCP